MNTREIKFRVWNRETNTWVHGPGQEVNLFGECILLGAFMNGITLEGLNKCIALQYTGLKDKNGKDIYEGDFLKGFEFPVAFRDGCFFVGIAYDLTEVPIYELSSGEIEVIGNVFEHPELY